MMSKIKALALSLLFLPFGAYASASLGDVAENLMAPTEIVTKLVLVACVIVGIALILVALAQYRIHRQSPKLVPLTTPITLLILGIFALLIPYGTRIFGPTGAAENTTQKAPTTLPMPDVSGSHATLPMPSKSDSQPSTPQSSPPPQTEQGSSESDSHWTDDPKYGR